MEIKKNFVDTFIKNSNFRKELRQASDAEKRKMLKQKGYSLDSLKTVHSLYKQAINPSNEEGTSCYDCMTCDND